MGARHSIFWTVIRRHPDTNDGCLVEAALLMRNRTWDFPLRHSWSCRHRQTLAYNLVAEDFTFGSLDWSAEPCHEAKRYINQSQHIPEEALRIAQRGANETEVPLGNVVWRRVSRTLRDSGQRSVGRSVLARCLHLQVLPDANLGPVGSACWVDSPYKKPARRQRLESLNVHNSTSVSQWECTGVDSLDGMVKTVT